MLARLAAPSLRRTPIATRAFSTSLSLRAKKDSKKADAPPEVRSNPLIGNYVPAKPAPLSEQEPPVSTDRPRATQTPRPDRAPVSSAEVPPNADMPPPPPPPPPSAKAEEPVQTPAEPESSHPYTAAKSSKPLSIDIASIISNRAAASAAAHGDFDPMKQQHVYPKAVTGRTVFVRDHMSSVSATSPAAAITMLNSVVSRQRLKSKWHSQKFHERRGKKKKRLRSQRWRARFKTGFKATVERVVELKKQGW